MPEDSSRKNHKSDHDEIHMPDFTELWKEMYFKTENAWADTFREYISTKGFITLLDKTLEQYLANEKITRQSMDKYLESNPLASKKDIARVAELLISLEEKVDNLEYQFSEGINSMANSLLKMVEYQEKLSSEIAAAQEDIKEMGIKLGNQNRRKKKTSPNDEQSS